MRVLVVLGALLVLAFGWTAPAGASAQSCGQVTVSVTLTADLDCSSTGLVVAADGITIDLAGHRLTGSVLLADVHGVVVRDGAVSTVDIWSGGDHQMLGLALGGVTIDASRDNVLEDSTITAGQVAIYSSDATAADNVIRKNRFVNASIFLAADPLRTKIEENEFRGHPAWGGAVVEVVQDRATTVRRNTFTGDGTGAALDLDQSAGAVVEGNVVREYGVGLRVRSSNDTLIRSNTLVHNGTAVDLVLPGGYGGLNVITANTMTNNGDAALRVQRIEAFEAPPDSTLIDHNIFMRNGHQTGSGAGLEINGDATYSSVSVSHSRAISNAGPGIMAVAVIDGGGNIARANGGAAQCIGVSC